ncbi:MAG: hypothetical protein ACREGC_04075 [Minisyncoccia bacterium]
MEKAKHFRPMTAVLIASGLLISACSHGNKNVQPKPKTVTTTTEQIRPSIGNALSCLKTIVHVDTVNETTIPPLNSDSGIGYRFVLIPTGGGNAVGISPEKFVNGQAIISSDMQALSAINRNITMQEPGGGSAHFELLNPAARLPDVQASICQPVGTTA